MTIEPALPWTQPEWLAEATGWIDQRCERAGEVEQTHVRWWSTVLRVPTAAGDLWFKAGAPTQRFEPRAIEVLSRLRPGRVPEVVAADHERGWMLMRDGGARLRELVESPGDLARFEELLPLYADLQLAAVPVATELLAAGVPDLRLASIPDAFERLLDDRDVLLVGAEALSAEELVRLRQTTPELSRLCDELAGHGIPETIQHDDLHDGNVFVGSGGYVVFDWGDSCVSHSFHTLVVTLRGIAYRHRLEPGGRQLLRLRDAYLEPFGRPRELAAAADLAYRTGTVARALAWYRMASAMEEPFRSEELPSVTYGLKRFLAGGPLGSWE